MDPRVREIVDDFFSSFPLQEFKKGEILISSDEEPSGVIYLKDGVVKQYAISVNGEEMVINTYKPDSFFPMSWVFNNTISNHYYEAQTAVTVHKAPKDKFLEIIKANPDILIDLVKRVYRGLDGYFLRMESLMGGSARTRLITELLIYAKRFGEKNMKGTIIRLKLTEKDLAANTGVARETISRELIKLKDKGLIDFKKNTLVISDIRILEEELSGGV